MPGPTLLERAAQALRAALRASHTRPPRSGCILCADAVPLARLPPADLPHSPKATLAPRSMLSSSEAVTGMAAGFSALLRGQQDGRPQAAQVQRVDVAAPLRAACEQGRAPYFL